MVEYARLAAAAAAKHGHLAHRAGVDVLAVRKLVEAADTAFAGELIKEALGYVRAAEKIVANAATTKDAKKSGKKSTESEE